MTASTGKTDKELQAEACLAARVKCAADYEAPKEDRRSAEEVAADIARTRLELEATVDELTNCLRPQNLLRTAKKEISSLVCRAAHGEVKPCVIVLGAVLGLVSLTVKVFRR